MNDNELKSIAKKIAGISFDSRTIQKGFAFFAIPGNRDDGSKYIHSAVEKGASHVFHEGEISNKLTDNVQFHKVSSARETLALLSSFFYNEPSKELEVYAVTGTNGKTTVAGLVRDILQANQKSTGLLSTVEYSWGDYLMESSRTTPDPITIQQAFRSMVDAGCIAASIEASSHALDQARLHGIPIKVAGFTNLTQDHLDYHEDFENYFLCKRRLFTDLIKQKNEGGAVINIDDKYGLRLYKELKDLGIKVISYSTCNDNADLVARNINLGLRETTFTLSSFGEQTTLKTHLIGRYNISNILCAVGMTLHGGIQLKNIVESIEHIFPRWGRLEHIKLPNGASVFVDYAHTPDAIEKALTALREVTHGSLTILFGCGGDRDKTKRPIMGKIASLLSDQVILTSDNPRTEDPETILNEIESGITPSCKYYIRLSDRKKAIKHAVTTSQNGDILLIAGKGHETYQEINGIKHPFDDREIVRELITTCFNNNN